MHRYFDWLVKPLLSSQQGGAGGAGDRKSKVGWSLDWRVATTTAAESELESVSHTHGGTYPGQEEHQGVILVPGDTV